MASNATAYVAASVIGVAGGGVNVNDGLLSAAAGVAANTGPMFCPVKTYSALRTRRAWSGE
ncbi:MAG: hypothetical protein E6J87_23305 [Deltaproteobacteria bacterium]|nr:MAG: hypothetical protein E6J87_23305 [Deltaproteobacteria bacterium]